ncbi:hypothetical protein NSK_002640 [Nannochloropsis salina CCMP1776]|uniref:Uncharacterized protein n=1 Tax=Nannochloropsis salina CCMP1776 TaxID=1027361 RepID=A0A4D9D308_9STRA|nr:hypothetical protein NSK_002640 [Nannochloropsis salina CCMP1776]|eukprot:TFJ85820.1 hypothetical protein NSK_002640 [Nannochloropsis salina CCMP1776]
MPRLAALGVTPQTCAALGPDVETAEELFMKAPVGCGSGKVGELDKQALQYLQVAVAQKTCPEPYLHSSVYPFPDGEGGESEQGRGAGDSGPEGGKRKRRRLVLPGVESAWSHLEHESMGLGERVALGTAVKGKNTGKVEGQLGGGREGGREGGGGIGHRRGKPSHRPSTGVEGRTEGRGATEEGTKDTNGAGQIWGKKKERDMRVGKRKERRGRVGRTGVSTEPAHKPLPPFLFLLSSSLLPGLCWHQLCLSLAAEAALTHEVEALYIDTNGSFCPRRLRQIMGGEVPSSAAGATATSTRPLPPLLPLPSWTLAWPASLSYGLGTRRSFCRRWTPWING